MGEAKRFIRTRDVLDSFASRLPVLFNRSRGTLVMPAMNGNGFLRAVRAREYYAEAPDGVDVWKFAFPIAAHQPLEDVHVRIRTAGAARDNGWVGSFECARGRHIDVIPWPAANAVVVAAANGVYIVDPAHPEQFNGFAAPVEINGVMFDESGRHMFVAESLRVYAFSSDKLFRWMSEPLDGHGVRFRGCGGRVLAIEVRHAEPEPDSEESSPSLVRLRTEDGTILRSRFRRGHRYWAKRTAA
jgi:hypothetical protein